jgi:hypothetical protein
MFNYLSLRTCSDVQNTIVREVWLRIWCCNSFARPYMHITECLDWVVTTLKFVGLFMRSRVRLLGWRLTYEVFMAFHSTTSIFFPRCYSHPLYHVVQCEYNLCTRNWELFFKQTNSKKQANCTNTYVDTYINIRIHLQRTLKLIRYLTNSVECVEHFENVG